MAKPPLAHATFAKFFPPKGASKVFLKGGLLFGYSLQHNAKVVSPAEGAAENTDTIYEVPNEHLWMLPGGQFEGNTLKAANGLSKVELLPTSDSAWKFSGLENPLMEFHFDAPLDRLKPLLQFSSKEDNRYVYNGIQVANTAVYATDGRRAVSCPSAIAGVKVTRPMESTDYPILHRKFVELLVSLKPSSVTFRIFNGWQFTCVLPDGTIIEGELLQGKFPNISRVIWDISDATNRHSFPITASDAAAFSRAKLKKVKPYPTAKMFLSPTDKAFASVYVEDDQVALFQWMLGEKAPNTEPHLGLAVNFDYLRDLIALVDLKHSHATMHIKCEFQQDDAGYVKDADGNLKSSCSSPIVLAIEVDGEQEPIIGLLMPIKI
jgi:hypothetical protein